MTKRECDDVFDWCSFEGTVKSLKFLERFKGGRWLNLICNSLVEI